MLRVPLDKAHIKRGLRLLYGYSQSTPKDVLLDPAWDRSVDIYPGMVMVNKATAASGASDVVTLVSATTQVPYGLCGVFVAPAYGIDEVRDQGVNAIPVWVLTEGSEFEVTAPAFDSAATWTFPTDGTQLLAHAQTTGVNRGKLVPSGTANATAKPVARVLSRPSTDRIIIAGLPTSMAY